MDNCPTTHGTPNRTAVLLILSRHHRVLYNSPSARLACHRCGGRTDCPEQAACYCTPRLRVPGRYCRGACAEALPPSSSDRAFAAEREYSTVHRSSVSYAQRPSPAIPHQLSLPSLFLPEKPTFGTLVAAWLPSHLRSLLLLVTVHQCPFRIRGVRKRKRYPACYCMYCTKRNLSFTFTKHKGTLGLQRYHLTLAATPDNIRRQIDLQQNSRVELPSMHVKISNVLYCTDNLLFL